MASTTTYTRNPSSGQFLSNGADGMVPVNDASTLAQLNSGALPYTTVGAGSAPTVAAPTNSMSAGGLSLPLNGSTAAMATPSTTTGQSTNPYTQFNNNIASLLTQIQNSASKGRTNLGGAIDSANTAAVTGGPAYNPAAGPANATLQQATLGGFAPEVTSLNTQLQNANAGIAGFNQSIGTIAKEELPTAISPGQSLVTPGGTVVSQGHSYTPTLNPSTGLIDGFDQNTGTWASKDTATGAGGGQGGTPTTSGAGSGTGTTSGSIDAIFGASNPIGAYATNKDYVQEISGLYQTVSTLGVAGNVTTLQQYIQNNAKGAPVTGQMILNAAGTYGVDPALLTTILLQESDFGSTGQAKDTMNPGNQGNTGTSTQSYSSWQQGVMATARNIAARISAAGSSNVPTANGGTGTTPVATNATAPSPTSNVGGTLSPAYAAKVAQLPTAIQGYATAGPAGVAYINDDRVPATAKAAVQTMAAQLGIPYLATADVASAQSLMQAQQNMDLMKTAATQTLGSGFWGGIGDISATYTNDATFGNAFPNFSKFQAYASAAISQLKALAGSGGGFRITQSEINTAQENTPNSTDTLTHAQAKMQVLQGLIDTKIANIWPDAQIPIQDDQGNKLYVPAKNYSAAVALGAIPL